MWFLFILSSYFKINCITVNFGRGESSKISNTSELDDTSEQLLGNSFKK